MEKRLLGRREHFYSLRVFYYDLVILDKSENRKANIVA